MKINKKIVSVILVAALTVSFMWSNAYAADNDSSYGFGKFAKASGSVVADKEDNGDEKGNSQSTETDSKKDAKGKNDTTSLESELSKLKKESDKIKNELNGLTAEKKAEKDNLDKITTQMNNLESQIDIVEKQIFDLTNEVNILEDQIDEKTLLIDAKELELAEKELVFNENYEIFKQRVRNMYMSSDASTLGMILGAESMSDFLEKSEMFSRVAESDQDTMDKLIEIRDQIEADKLVIEDEKLAIEANRDNIELKKNEAEKKRDELNDTKLYLDELSKESEENLLTIENKVQNVRMTYEETQDKIDAMESEIKRLIAENASAPDSEYVGGVFMWPVPNFYTVSCPYMGYPGHSGMDITGKTSGAISGAPFVAAGAGTVIAVVRGYTGYGHYVIVDHGGGYTTLYAHASSISVSKGQSVAQGTPLGAVGSTGNSTGPHLHFEVRINGAHQNPAGFLKG